MAIVRMCHSEQDLMREYKNILFGLVLCLVAVVFAFPAVASNGCDNEDNNRIVPTLALCSTHAYNVGEAENPTSSKKAYMRDIVAMKTTVMTQQMNKQYDYLETMIRRLKTQLEKAVLTTGLQAKGAGGAASSSGSYRSDNRNIFMAGVKDCNVEMTTIKVFECLHTNWQTIYNSSNNGSELSTALKKQLAHDYQVMTSNSIPVKTNTKVVFDGKEIDCANYAGFSNKKNFQVCLDNLAAGIRQASEAVQQRETQGQRQYQRQNSY